MQIGIIGNANNYPFLLGEGLRSIGVNVRLVVTREGGLDHPAHAGLTPEGLPDWVFDASSLGVEAFEFQRQSIGAALDFVLHEADLVILNDMAPSLHNLLPLPVVSQLTGADLTYYASGASGAAGRSHWTSMTVAMWEEMVVRQRAGIRRSRLLAYPWPGMVPAGDEALDQIGVEDDRRLFLAYADIQRVRATAPPGGPSLKILGVTHVAPGPEGSGGGDQEHAVELLRGFRKFLDTGGKGVMTLIETGAQPSETRAAAQALGLDDHLAWKGPMSLAELYREMEACDVLCCQFGEPAPGMTAFNGLAAGRPVLARFPLDLMAQHYSEPWPVRQTQSAEDVAGALWRLQQDPEHRDRLGAEARRFAETWLTPIAAAETLMRRLQREIPVHRLEAERREHLEEIRLLRQRAAFGPDPGWGFAPKPFSVLELDPAAMTGPDGALWSIDVERAPQGDGADNAFRSAAVLLEDGVPQGPGHALHASIRELGGGRYSHWGRSLFFSTSDGSSPKSNGRRYTLRFPKPS